MEFWYREQMSSRDVVAWENATVSLFEETDPKALKTLKPADSAQVGFTRSFGQWRKLAVRLRVPPSRVGTLRLDMVHRAGTVLLDGLRVRAISDREADSLKNFIEAE